MLLPRALLRRLLPRHPKFGFPWVRNADGSITFHEVGFVAAKSPAALLARHNYEVAHIRRVLDGIRVDRSLEVGCGYGRLTPILAEYSCEHFAVDINRSALLQARETYPDHEYLEASADRLPYPRDHFGLVTTWTVLQHVPPDRIARAATELVRVLEPGGTLLTCEETRHANRPPKGQPHTWHRHVEDYRRLFAPLTIQHTVELLELDRLPDMESPGRIMVWG